MARIASVPQFRTEDEGKGVKLYLCCSFCDTDIRQLTMEDKIDITRAYFCRSCDPGYIVKNPLKDGGYTYMGAKT